MGLDPAFARCYYRANALKHTPAFFTALEATPTTSASGARVGSSLSGVAPGLPHFVAFRHCSRGAARSTYILALAGLAPCHYALATPLIPRIAAAGAIS